MAITTLDGIIAGAQYPRFFAKNITPTLVAGKPQCLWGLGGIPGAGSYDTTLNGVTLSSSSANVAGQIPWTDPGAGNSYLSRFAGVASVAGMLILADRLWHNGGYTITSSTAQSSTTPTLPSRDANGGTTGVGVQLALEVSAVTGAASPTITVSYTEPGGTSGRSGTNIDATAASAAAGSFFRIGLQAGDTGVKSVQSLTLSASWVSGTINLVAYRQLAALELPASQIPNAMDALTSGFPQLFNGTVPFLFFIPNTTTASNIFGQVAWTQG